MKNNNCYLHSFVLNHKFNNPLISLSGCYGYGFEYKDFFNINLLGAITLKGLTLEPRNGNPGIRIAETPSGILNSIGLENPGFNYFAKNIYPNIKKEIKTNIIININGSSIDDYIQLAYKIIELKDIEFVELNLSCPNVKSGGMIIGVDPKQVYDVTSKVKKILKDKILIVKLSPNVTDITEIALAAEKAGADCLSLINTLVGMEIDIKTKKPLLGNIFGGLSGPCIFPIALKIIYQVYQVVKIPIIGMGGVNSADDVIKMMLAGASLVGMGTMMMTNPEKVANIINELEKYCKDNKINNIIDIIGACHGSKNHW
ncbi:MAG: dihydroorotate dehydrogenase [Mycoplasmoidaceae bacterium]